MRKWRQRPLFVRFIDGDSSNYSKHNIDHITLKPAVQNHGVWTTNLDSELTEKERELLNDHRWRRRLSMYEPPQYIKECFASREQHKIS